VSENDNVTAQALQKLTVNVMGMSAWRGKPSGDSGKQT